MSQDVGVATSLAERLEARRQIERHISEQLDLEQLLRIVAREALRLIGGTFSIVYLREGDVLRPRAWAELPDWIGDVRVPIGSGVAGRAVESGRGVIANDYADSPVAIPPFNNVSVRLLAQPLVAGGRSLGAMLISRDDTGADFTHYDLSTLVDFATQAAIAIENARLFAEAKRTAAEYQALFEVAGLVGSTLDVERILDLIVDRCRALMGVGSAGVFKFDAVTGVLAYERGIGLSAEFITALRVRMGEGTTGNALSERKAVWSADILNDPRLVLSPETRALVTREGYRAALSVPIVSVGAPHGVLSVYWWEPHTPSTSEVALMTALASQAAIALQNAELYGAATAQGKRLATLARLTETLTSTLAFEEVFDRVVSSAMELYGVSVARLWLVDEDGKGLSLRAHAGTRALVGTPTRLELGEGVMGRIVSDRASIVITDLRSDPQVKDVERLGDEGAISFAGVPLVLGDRVLGALSVALRAARRFSEEDLSLLHSLANHAAIAIENARLYGEATRHAEALDVRANRLRTLARLTTMVSSSLDAQGVLKAVARAAAEIMHVGFVAVYVADEPGRMLEMRAASDEQMGAAMPVKRRAFGDGLVGWVAEHRRPLRIADVLVDGRAMALDWAARYRLRSFVGVPIIFQDSLLGVLTLNDPAPLHLSRDDEDLLDSFVSQAAVAIRNTRLFALTSEHLEQTRSLLEVAEILNSTLDPTRLLKQVAIKIAQVCRVDRCSIEQWDGDRVIPLMSQFADGHKDERLWSAFMTMPSYPPREVPAHAQAIETRRPVVISDTASTDLIPREWVDTFGHTSYMVVPMIRQDAVIGVMNLDCVARAGPFEAWQLDLAMGIAGQLALTIENTRLYGEAQERLRETTTLLGVARVLSQRAPAAEVMRQTAREVAHAFGAAMVGVYLLDERKERLIPTVGYHVPKHLLHTFATRPFILARFPILREAWDSGRAFWSSDVNNDPRMDRATFEGVDAHSVLLAPTMVRGHALGALFLVWWGTGREFQPAEIRLIEGVASQLGLAMENTELARQTQAKLEELSVLHELSRAVTGQLDQADLIDTIEQQMARLLDVRHMVIVIDDDSSGALEVVLRVKDGQRRDEEPRRCPRDAAGLSGIVFRSGEPIRTEDYSGECARHGVDPVPESVDLPHWLGVPMMAGNRTLGVLALRGRDRAFTEGDQRLLGSIADLTALALRSARLYEERARAHADLAAAQDQLVRTEKLRAMGEMASGVAHDFNNVLAAVLGRAELLLQVLQDPKHRHWAQVIERSALDGARTVRRLQDFTRIRRDHPVVPVDLNQVVQQTLEATESSWQPESQSRGVHFDVVTSLATPLPAVSGDPSELREALTNLILNALDAMPNGGRLTLTTSAADGQVEIAVADTGGGIPAAIRHKIFDPFFTTKGPKGTGLGLSMTYGIVARHGARIAVESEERCGTTFRLVFPATDTVDEPAGPPQPPAASAPPLRCLVVDDEEDVAAVLGDMLASHGHRVDVVGTGQEAVARVSASRFDLVLTDLAMPGMTGWDVARAIKSISPTTPVVLVSGFGVELSADDLRANGVDLVLAKPLKLHDIETAVAVARRDRAE